MFGTEKNPKGPSFKNLREIRKTFSDTQLSFCVPESRGYAANGMGGEPDDHPIRDDAGNLTALCGELDSAPYGNCASVHSSGWQFSGLPLLQRDLGHFNFVLELVEVHDLAINESLFSAECLVQQAHRFIRLGDLSSTHSGFSDVEDDLSSYEWPSNLSPARACWVDKGGVKWLRFETIPLRRSGQDIIWWTPISARHYLSCRFVISKHTSNAGNAYRLAERISNKNYLTLMNQIMDTMKLNLDGNSEQEGTGNLDAGADLSNLFPSSEDIKAAAHVMWMWSDAGCNLSRPSLEEVEQHIESLLVSPLEKPQLEAAC